MENVKESESTKPNNVKKRRYLKLLTISFVAILIISASVLYINHNMPQKIITIEDYNSDYIFDDFFNVRSPGPVEKEVAYRMRPAGGSAKSCDRIYVAGGYEDNYLHPYGLYAYSPINCTNAWDNNPFPTESPITTEVVVTNFGSEANPAEADIRIFFGCEDGKVYALQDNSFETSFYNSYPTGHDVWSYDLNGAVSTKIIYYTHRGGGFNALDKFFAATDNGFLYAFQGPYDPQNTSHTPTLMWSVNVSAYGLTAPTVSYDGEYVFVGSRDGLLHGYRVISGFPIPDWMGTEYIVSDGYWSSSPVAFETPCVIYAATDDGYIHSIWGANGTARTGWENGYQIENMLLDNDVDGGNLTEMEFTPDGSYILVGSDTGYYYTISTSDINVSMKFDTNLGTLETECIVAPYYDWRFSKCLYVTAICTNSTETDRSDDLTVVYCLASTGNNLVFWRRVFEGVSLGGPISYINNQHISKADIILATVTYETDGSLSQGRIYSWNAAVWIPS